MGKVKPWTASYTNEQGQRVIVTTEPVAPVYTYKHNPEAGWWEVYKDDRLLFGKATEREAADWVEYRRIAFTKGMGAAQAWWRRRPRTGGK